MDYNLSNYKHLTFINILDVKSFHTEKTSWRSITYHFAGIGIYRLLDNIPEFTRKLHRFSLPSATNVMSFDPERDKEIMLELNGILEMNNFFYDPTWDYQIEWNKDILIYNKEHGYELLERR